MLTAEDFLRHANNTKRLKTSERWAKDANSKEREYPGQMKLQGLPEPLRGPTRPITRFVMAIDAEDE